MHKYNYNQTKNEIQSASAFQFELQPGNCDLKREMEIIQKTVKVLPLPIIVHNSLLSSTAQFLE